MEHTFLISDAVAGYFRHQIFYKNYTITESEVTGHWNLTLMIDPEKPEQLKDLFNGAYRAGISDGTILARKTSLLK